MALGACPPESHVLLAELARLLPPEVPLARLASLSEGWGPLPVEAEVAWLIAEILREPARLASLPMGGRVLRAVQRLSLAEAPDAEALIDALCSHADPELQLEGLRHLGDALELGLVTLTHALALGVRALEATDSRVALQAAELLAEPWAARPELAPPIRLLHLLTGRSERLALASLRGAARRGDDAARGRGRVSSLTKRSPCGINRGPCPPWRRHGWPPRSRRSAWRSGERSDSSSRRSCLARDCWRP